MTQPSFIPPAVTTAAGAPVTIPSTPSVPAATPAPQPPAQQQATVTSLPVIIDEGKFEGKEVGASSITVSGTSKLTADPTNPQEHILTFGDVATIQMEVKCTGVSFDIDANGIITRVQRVKPIERSARIVDVLRSEPNLRIR